MRAGADRVSVAKYIVRFEMGCTEREEIKGNLDTTVCVDELLGGGGRMVLSLDLRNLFNNGHEAVA